MSAIGRAATSKRKVSLSFFFVVHPLAAAGLLGHSTSNRATVWLFLFCFRYQIRMSTTTTHRPGKVKLTKCFSSQVPGQISEYYFFGGQHAEEDDEDLPDVLADSGLSSDGTGEGFTPPPLIRRNMTAGSAHHHRKGTTTQGLSSHYHRITLCNDSPRITH